MTAALSTTMPADKLPRLYGRYVLFDVVTKGAMGALFRAYDPEKKQIVMVKRPHTSLKNPEALARFREEAALSFQLSHQNLVHALDKGEVNGEPYLVLEYIAGQDLENFIDRLRTFERPRSLPIFSAIIDQLCQGLGYAHQQMGFVHRDISPANIMIGYDGRVRLVDYGFALWDLKETKTVAGMTVGTPGFMAPEQLTGSGAEPRSDLYALGAVFWYMLLAQPLLLPENYTREQMVERISAWMDLPNAFVDFLWKALQKSPADRYQTAEAMRAGLAQALGETISSMQEVSNYISEIFLSAKKEADAEQAAWHKLYSEEKNRTAIMPVGESAKVIVDVHPSPIQKRRILPWLLPTILAVAAYGAGFLHGRLWAPTPTTKTVESLPVFSVTTPTPADPPLAEAIAINSEPMKNHSDAKHGRTVESKDGLSLARDYVRSGQSHLAQKILADLVNDPKQAGEAHLLLGELAYKQGHYDEATAQASRAMKKGMKIPALLLRATSELEAGHGAKAKADFEHVLRINPKQEDAREGLRAANESLK